MNLMASPPDPTDLQIPPATLSPTFVAGLTPAQREVLQESSQRAAQYHQVVVEKGLGPDKYDKKG